MRAELTENLWLMNREERGKRKKRCVCTEILIIDGGPSLVA